MVDDPQVDQLFTPVTTTAASANLAPTAPVVEREGVDDPKKRLLFVGILIASVFAIHKFKKLFK